jgi:hypothetical protein
MKVSRLIPVGILAVLITPVRAQDGKGQVNSDFAQGDFYIVSSIDLAKRQILLKRPTEVTELMKVDGATRYFEERGKAIRLTDLRAGDTVYITSMPAAAQPVAVTIHKGPMTPEVLRERYLKNAK